MYGVHDRLATGSGTTNEEVGTSSVGDAETRHSRPVSCHCRSGRLERRWRKIVRRAQHKGWPLFFGAGPALGAFRLQIDDVRLVVKGE